MIEVDVSDTILTGPPCCDAAAVCLTISASSCTKCSFKFLRTCSCDVVGSFGERLSFMSLITTGFSICASNNDQLHTHKLKSEVHNLERKGRYLKTKMKDVWRKEIRQRRQEGCNWRIPELKRGKQ